MLQKRKVLPSYVDVYLTPAAPTVIPHTGSTAAVSGFTPVISDSRLVVGTAARALSTALLLRRSWRISAMILKPISGGVTAPNCTPAGHLTRCSNSGGTPLSPKYWKIVAALLPLATNPR